MLACVDFTTQIGFKHTYNKTEEKITDILKEIARETTYNKTFAGALIVLGSWSPIVKGMVQLKPPVNPINQFLTINLPNLVDNIDLIKSLLVSSFDGAIIIIIDSSGQILGAGVYLIVDNPLVKIPEGCGTRHKSAASFSLREDVKAVFTLSEETNIIRVWKNGKCLELSL